MTTPSQLAQELAERSAKALTQMPQFDELPSEVFRIQAAEIILRELSLESLLADKARLDWLETRIKANNVSIWFANKAKPPVFCVNLPGLMEYTHEQLRSAIDSAMSEKKGEQG